MSADYNVEPPINPPPPATPPGSPPPSSPPPPSSAGPLNVGPDEDWRPQAIVYMTLGGGIFSLLVALICFVLALFGLVAPVFCVAIVNFGLSGVIGGLCLFKGIMLLNKPLATQPPPMITAILQIITICSCDIVNLALGIAILVFLSDPTVKAKFAPPGNSIGF